jgi:Sec-independent protein translocase protein TatA
MFGFGGLSELFFILFLAMLIFGPEKLPEIGRLLAKGMAEVRKASNELKRTLSAELAVNERELEAGRPPAATGAAAGYGFGGAPAAALPLPAETVPAQTVAAETVPAETVPAETVPAEGVAAEGSPAEVVSAPETVAAEGSPAEVISAPEAAAAEAAAVGVAPADAAPPDARGGPANPG